MGHGTVFNLLYNSPEIESVTVADYDFEKVKNLSRQINNHKLQVKQLDVSNFSNVSALMREHDSAISCVNYWYNLELSKAAIETRTNFCDLGETIISLTSSWRSTLEQELPE